MGICEECGDVGHEVHHKIPLSLNNIDDDSISVNESNLQLLCTSCHNAKRGENLIRSDVEFDSNGDLVQRKQYKHNQI
jgi:5-methylcytosine-specific restriction endonuclease McrA